MKLKSLVTITLLAVLLGGCKSRPGMMTQLPNQALKSASRAESPYSVLREAPSGSLPSLDEELWIIARPRTVTTMRPDDLPGCGAMMTRIASREIPLPLKHTAVQATVNGYIATVQVTQQFHNPYDGKIEAVYVFPLPDNAAVNSFIMAIGERRIRGIIRERDEAEKIYREARRQGHVASLLTQERPNIFTQSVANIEPGKAIDITIQYFNTLSYADGWYEFVFPMVVGPRYNPAGFTHGVGAAARDSGGISGQKTEVTYLRPEERSAHDISLQVNLETGVEIEETTCATHLVSLEKHGPGLATVRLNPSDSLPNKDFVLRFRLGGSGVKSSWLGHRDARGGYFSLMLYPPQGLQQLARQPLEMVFVLDCSGSMHGAPLAQAKAAVQRALERLQPGDSFQVVSFSESAHTLGTSPLEATPANMRTGLDYVRRLNSEGGTEMLQGIKAALEFPHDPTRLRFVCFLTDGYIGNEEQILREVHRRLGDSRIFSFGVGSSPNRYLLNHLAKLGRGAAAYLGLQDDAAQVMDTFVERISHPALTDLAIHWDGADVSEVFPRQIPDLFAGRPVMLTGRFSGAGTHTVRIRGRVGADKVELSLPVNLDAPPCREALASVWARMKIADLADQATYSANPFLRSQIKQVALDHNLMSAFTAFVAVDSSQRTAGTQGTTVPAPVPVPEGVKYDTTVRE